MKKKAYIFTNKGNSKKGIMAVSLGAIANTTLAAVVYASFSLKGQIPERYGAAILLVALFSLVGITLALLGLIEKDKYRLIPGVGLALNIFSIGFVVFLVYISGVSLW
jgi:uncharacterized membrane protein